MEKAPKFPVTITTKTKDRLLKMADETGLTQTQIVNMAILSVLANYDTKGSFIFADLLNPEHRS